MSWYYPKKINFEPAKEPTMNIRTFISHFLLLIAILVTILSGCERIQQVLPSDTTATTTSSIKIGVSQPSGYYIGFLHGAELARTEINNSGGVLGIQIEFIVMNNQGARIVPDAVESVRIAKTLIEQEDVVALLGPIFSNNSMQVGPVVQQLQRPIIPGSAGEYVTSAGECPYCQNTD